MTIRTILEPAAATPTGAGYVAWGASDDTLYFPHVDSCCALVLVLKDQSLVGGHVPAVWGPGNEFAYSPNMEKIYSLMEITRRNHAGGTDVIGIIFVGPQEWKIPFNVIRSKIDEKCKLPVLYVNTDAADKGVNVRVRWSFEIVVADTTDCATGIKKRNKWTPVP